VLIPGSLQQYSFYTWDSDIYSEMMLDMMHHLEPRYEEKDEIVFDELEEITEVVLYVKGKFDIGFELNNERYFVKRFQNSASSVSNTGAMIGAHGVAFNKRSRFVYKTASRCSGFFIRKRNWCEVMDKNDIVRDSLYQ
tara:strand:- start:487 stop:900 length:414 start_codon:yes stop_codon:yes gene_type:complete